MDYILLILIIILIFKDDIRKIFIKVEKPTTEDAIKEEIKERKEEFEKIMAYSINDALKSKRGEL